MPRIYKKPPLIEALCEVKFAETSGDFASWDDFYQKIKEFYPTKTELPRGIEFQITPDADANINPVEFIKRFISTDNSQLVQATQDSLTLNRLSPYLSYEHLKKAFNDVFKIYIETFSPKRFANLSMRYVNQIIVPHGNFLMNEYFGLLPTIPEGVTESLNSVFVQVQVVPQIDNHILQITLRSVPTNAEDKSIFFLDIFDIAQINSEIKEDGILKIMDDAHTNIEHVFEHIIQDKARQLFQEKKENE